MTRATSRPADQHGLLEVAVPVPWYVSPHRLRAQKSGLDGSYGVVVDLDAETLELVVIVHIL